MTEQQQAGGTSTVMAWTEPPAGKQVASFRTYGDVERAVQYLASQNFPVERARIVGRDVEWVEQIIGRATWGHAALRGAAAGAVTGALLGWIFGLLSWITPLIASLALAAYGLVFGAVVGAILGLIIYAFQHGKRDFESVRVLQPAGYELVADAAVAEQAAAILAGRE
jgi:hypothetical protein